MYPVGRCTSPKYCTWNTDELDLCTSCKLWLKELEDSHKNGGDPSWRNRCRSSEWSENYLEVARFFMPTPSNPAKDAKTTDIFSLLEVMKWMKNAVFLGKTQVDLVTRLVYLRNCLVHAPAYQLPNRTRASTFSAATNFINYLHIVRPNDENVECLKRLECLEDNGVFSLLPIHESHDFADPYDSPQFIDVAL